MIPTRAHLDQNLLDAALPQVFEWIFSVFLDLLVYSKCENLKKNSGQFWTSVTNINWMKAEYDLFQA